MMTSDVSKREANRTRLLRMIPKGGVCAEIGVWEGQFSRKILQECAPARLHLIDPWTWQPEFANTGFGRPKNEHLMEEKYQAVRAAFADEPRVVIHRSSSEAALSAMPDHSLDWVYVDGNHNAPFVDRDLELCLQKVRPDGIIAGDDYNWMAEELGAPVRQAVTRLMAQLGPQAELKVMANQYLIRRKSSAG